MFDPDGRKPLGVSHWVFYNIPGNVTSLNRGDGTPKQPRYTLGKGTDWMGFRGPCPPPGEAPHHYVLTVYALDLPPTLAPGLDRDALIKAMTGHTLSSTSMDILYQR
jgi:Raf kinase inhibitor-like YbhB/YbcL family protein